MTDTKEADVFFPETIAIKTLTGDLVDVKTVAPIIDEWKIIRQLREIGERMGHNVDFDNLTGVDILKLIANVFEEEPEEAAKILVVLLVDVDKDASWVINNIDTATLLQGVGPFFQRYLKNVAKEVKSLILNKLEQLGSSLPSSPGNADLPQEKPEVIPENNLNQ